MERHTHHEGQTHEHGHAGAERMRGHHDWHSTTYVQEWIDTDVTRDDERRLLIRRMLSFAPHPPQAALRILDVGAGYGLLSEEALGMFSNAHVTLQDYSEPMLSHAKRRLAPYADRTAFVTADFSLPGWSARLGGPFDIAISGIAIHNLSEPRLIEGVYREVAAALKPDGVFLDMDYLNRGLTLQDHLGWLRNAGFATVDTPLNEERRVVFVASMA